MSKQKERILSLAKTYPSPSAKYSETSCIAGINANGEMRRLYPVPFRMLEEEKQFKKWQWVDISIEKSTKDKRQESHKIRVDNIIIGDRIDTKNEWEKRREWLDKIPSFVNPDDLEEARKNDSITIALVRPKRLVKLGIEKESNPDWTEEQKKKLIKSQMQGDLFAEDADAKRDLHTLRKLPYKFYYHYICDTPQGEKEFKHKIVDWEAGALFWNCYKSKDGWEDKFRQKYETEFSKKDLMFIMGNIHRFEHQWLIIGVVYPPKQTQPVQESLF